MLFEIKMHIRSYLSFMKMSIEHAYNLYRNVPMAYYSRMECMHTARIDPRKRRLSRMPYDN